MSSTDVYCFCVAYYCTTNNIKYLQQIQRNSSQAIRVAVSDPNIKEFVGRGRKWENIFTVLKLDEIPARKKNEELPTRQDCRNVFHIFGIYACIF
jgi:hypothetical protein